MINNINASYVAKIVMNDGAFAVGNRIADNDKMGHFGTILIKNKSQQKLTFICGVLMVDGTICVGSWQ